MDKITKDKIFNDNLGLVYNVVRKCFKGYSQEDTEDLLQEGFLTLYKVIDKFDESKGFKFSTYACSSIWGSLTKYAETRLKQKKSTSVKIGKNKYKSIYLGVDILSLDAKVVNCESEDATVLDTIECDNNDFNALETELEVMWIIEELERVQKCNLKKYKDADKIILMKLEGYDYKKIGEVLGVSRATVQNRVDAVKEYFQGGLSKIAN